MKSSLLIQGVLYRTGSVWSLSSLWSTEFESEDAFGRQAVVLLPFTFPCSVEKVRTS